MFPTIWKRPKAEASRSPLSRGRSLLAVFLLAAGAARCRISEPHPGTRVPLRVVALAPSLTEIVFALGAGDRLVGTSEHSDYPAAARRIPRIGGLTPDLERIVALRPDLVLATTEGNPPWVATRLQERGICVLSTSGQSLPDIFRTIKQTGDALGVGQRASALVRSLSERRARVLAHARGHRPQPALFLVWPDPPQVAGGGNFGDRLLAEAGGRNLASRIPGWPVVSREFLWTLPEGAVVVYPREAETDEAFRTAFFGPSGLFAGAARRPRLLAVEASLLERPGPRSVDALEIIARAFEEEH